MYRSVSKNTQTSGATIVFFATTTCFPPKEKTQNTGLLLGYSVLIVSAIALAALGVSMGYFPGISAYYLAVPAAFVLEGLIDVACFSCRKFSCRKRERGEAIESESSIPALRVLPESISPVKETKPDFDLSLELASEEIMRRIWRDYDPYFGSIHPQEENEKRFQTLIDLAKNASWLHKAIIATRMIKAIDEAIVEQLKDESIEIKIQRAVEFINATVSSFGFEDLGEAIFQRISNSSRAYFTGPVMAILFRQNSNKDQESWFLEKSDPRWKGYVDEFRALPARETRWAHAHESIFIDGEEFVLL